MDLGLEKYILWMISQNYSILTLHTLVAPVRYKHNRTVTEALVKMKHGVTLFSEHLSIRVYGEDRNLMQDMSAYDTSIEI